MTIDEAKAWLAQHPARQPVVRIACPPHSSYAEINVRATFDRVRIRERSLIDVAEQTRQRLRLLSRKAAA